MEVDQAHEQGSPEEPFDLEAYIAPYSGHTRINRLLFIAQQCR